MLLTWTPVPGTTSPEPVPFEQVTEAQTPSASSTEIWVVEPRPSPGTSQQLGDEIGVVKALGELLGAQLVGGFGRPHQLLDVARPHLLQGCERVGDQDAARGRGRVGQHLAPLEGGTDRLAPIGS